MYSERTTAAIPFLYAQDSAQLHNKERKFNETYKEFNIFIDLEYLLVVIFILYCILKKRWSF